MTPLVLVHGYLGGSQQWQEQELELGDAVEVVTVDLPGFGENADLPALTTIAGFGRWVLEQLDARGITQFNLLGHSMGGMVVQEVVAQAPSRVDRLILYGTGATGVLPGRFETIAESKRRVQADGAKATARRISATWFLQNERAAAYEDCASIAERCSLETMLTGLDAMDNWRGEKALAAIQAQTLIIWGDKDRTYNWSQTEQLWHSISRSSLAVVPDAAHAVHFEKPRLFNSILRDFLNTPFY